MLTQRFIYKNANGAFFVGFLHGMRFKETTDKNKAMRFSSFPELQSFVNQHDDEFCMDFYNEEWEEITLVVGN